MSGARKGGAVEEMSFFSDFFLFSFFFPPFNDMEIKANIASFVVSCTNSFVFVFLSPLSKDDDDYHV